MLYRIPQLIDDYVVAGNIAWRANLVQMIPADIVPQIQRAKFRRIVRYVAQRSEFYRRRFKELGIDPRAVRTPEDLGTFYTTAQDLREEPIEAFLCDRPEHAFETTGTTAKTSKRLYFSRKEVTDIGRDGALGLYNLGLRAEDRVVDGFDYSFWNAPFTLRASLDCLGCFHVTAAKIPPQEFYERAKPYRFTAICCEPSVLVVVSEVAKAKGTWPLKLMVVGGENMSEQTRRYVEAIWKAPVYMSYGQTETFGSIGVECPAQNGYHIDDFSLYCEIAEPGTDGFGELVYTILSRRVMPLIRYRSSDITAFLKGSCTCALRISRRLAKIRGRTDEMVNCGMGNLSPWFFENLLEGLPQISSDWQVAVRRTGNYDTIEFRLELLPSAAEDGVSVAIQQRIEKRIPESWRNYQLGLFKLAFRFVAPGSLRRGRKLRRLLDERTTQWV